MKLRHSCSMVVLFFPGHLHVPAHSLVQLSDPSPHVGFSAGCSFAMLRPHCRADLCGRGDFAGRVAARSGQHERFPDIPDWHPAGLLHLDCYDQAGELKLSYHNGYVYKCKHIYNSRVSPI